MAVRRGGGSAVARATLGAGSRGGVGGVDATNGRTTESKRVTDEYVPVGARSFTVASAQGFRPGDPVIVRRIGNEDWIDAVGMNADDAGRAAGGRSTSTGTAW